jgi:hypothetical protein
MTQFKAGVSRLPNKNIFENVLKTKKILMLQPKPLSLKTSFFLTVAADLICDVKKKDINKRNAINWNAKVKQAATYDQNYGLMKANLVTNMINFRKEEREAILEDIMKYKFSYFIGDNFHEAQYHPELNQIRYFDRMTGHLEYINSQKAKPCFLDEPLKNRSLSINTTPFQLFSRDLQSDLLDCWHDCKYSTMNEDELNHKVFQTELKSDNGFFYSVDYSAATDYLNPNVTRCLLKRCILNFPVYQQYEEFYLTSVDSKWIDMKKFKIISNFPSKELEKSIRVSVPDYMQTHGQMMGNNLSFPLLCMANLATFLEARYRSIIDDLYPGFFENEEISVELYKEVSYFINRLEEIDDRLLKINGDDAAAEMTQAELEIQNEACTGVGLVINENKSIGIDVDFKYRRNLFNINSRQFWYDTNSKVVTEIGYLNQRLLYKWNVKTCLKDDNKNAYRDESDLFTSHDAFVHQACKGRPDLLQALSMIYIDTHYKSMNKESHPEMWSIHPNLGGKGMFDYSGKPDYYAVPNFIIEKCYESVFAPIEIKSDSITYGGGRFHNITSPNKKWLGSHEQKLVVLSKLHNFEVVRSILKASNSGIAFREYTDICVNVSDMLEESIKIVSAEFVNYDLSDNRLRLKYISNE